MDRGQQFPKECGKSHVGRRAPVDNTPVIGIAKVFGYILELLVVDLGRFDCKFGKGSDRVAYVGANNSPSSKL
jgi:hypothetical protein